MRAVLILLALAAVTNCSGPPSAADNAEADYNFLAANGGNLEDLCASATKAVDAYRRERNSGKYREWREEAQAKCGALAIRRRIDSFGS